MSEIIFPRIIASVACAPFQGMRTSDVIKFGQGLTEAGYEGTSALPYRAENIAQLYQYFFPPLILVEDAWNPGSFNNIGLAILEGIGGQLRRIAGDRTEPPILQDTLFFPNRSTSQKIIDSLMRSHPDAYYVLTGRIMLPKVEGNGRR